MTYTERLYHVIVVNRRTGRIVVVTDYPTKHEHACTNMNKQSSTRTPL